MSQAKPAVTCECCGLAKPWNDYYRGSNICSLCEGLSVRDAVKTVRAYLFARQHYLDHATAGRKEAKRTAKLAQLELTGKRCTHCHARKAPVEFNKCAPMADGLQSGCRSCNQIIHVCTAGGVINGRHNWHVIRDALRAQNDAK